MAQDGQVKRGLYTFRVEHDRNGYGDEMVHVSCADCSHREQFVADGDAGIAVDDWMYAHIKTPCVHCGYCAADGKHHDCEADAVDPFAAYKAVAS